MKILVVEDEPVLRDGLVDLLRGAGHETEAVADGMTAVERGREEVYDLVLLDLMLPRLNGIEVCRRLRTARPGLPILMLTARGAEGDKVAGLRAGADDYVTKPFGVRELLARVDAFARRAAAAPAPPEIIEEDGCRFDLGRCVAYRDGDADTDAADDDDGDGEGEEIHLTAREVGVIRWLHRHRNRSVTRAELLEQVWGTVGTLQTRTVDMTIAKLRQKIERDPSQPRIILTVTGVGYAWAGASS